MASFADIKYDGWTIVLETQIVDNPPCCWIIVGKEGNRALVQNDNLPVFEEWLDAQGFIEKTEIEGLKPKLLYWEDLIKEVKGKVQKIILDMGDGTYVSFSPKL